LDVGVGEGGGVLAWWWWEAEVEVWLLVGEEVEEEG